MEHQEQEYKRNRKADLAVLLSEVDMSSNIIISDRASLVTGSRLYSMMYIRVYKTLK